MQIVRSEKMIHFIVCEDEPLLAKEYTDAFDKFMMRYDIDYKCHSFKGYTDAWKQFIQKEMGFKIYLLDIKTAKGSGLDAARYIREELDDWVSMIIIITSYSEYKYEALGKRLMLVDFINKLDNCEKRLESAFTICIKNYDNRHKSLKYTYKNTIYNIEFRHIISIEKEQESKRCIIKTIYGEYYIQETISKIMKMLDNRFVKCCRGLIINLEQVESYDKKTNTLIFKNKEKTTAIAREKKKEIIRYVRGIY